jgi:hypothetical protein
MPTVYTYSREQIHVHLANQCRCYFESREAAIPMARKLNLRVHVWDKYYYIMPRGYNPAQEKAEGKPHAWPAFTPASYTEG